MSFTFLLGVLVRLSQDKKTRIRQAEAHTEDVCRLDIGFVQQIHNKRDRLFWKMCDLQVKVWAPEADQKLWQKWIKSSNRPEDEPEPSAGKPNLEDRSKVSP